MRKSDQRLIPVVLSMILLGIITTSCTGRSPTSTALNNLTQTPSDGLIATGSVPSATRSPGFTSTATSTSTSTNTPVPFSDIDVDLFPCIFDICPSEVELSEALSLFGERFEIEQDGDIVSLRPINQDFSFNRIVLTVDDQQIIQFRLSYPKYDDLLLSELPERLGNPSEIRVVSEFPQGDITLSILFLFWNDLGIVAEYWIESNQLTETYLHYCVEDTEFKPTFLYLWSPEHLDAPPVIEQNSDLQFRYHSLEDAWGMTIDEFIQEITQGNYCFDVPL